MWQEDMPPHESKCPLTNAEALKRASRRAGRVATIARLWMRRGAHVFEARDAPLRSLMVEALPPAGARVLLALPDGASAALDVASADDFQTFTAAVMREAITERKRFYDGAFVLRIDGVGEARGKRMVSFTRDGARIFHAWCEEAILHTVWKPVELQQGMRMLTDEVGRCRPSSASDAR